MINVNKKGKTHMNLPKPFTTPCATASSRGGRLPGVPLEIPAVWGPWEPPHLAVLSRLLVTTRLDEPLRSQFQVDLYLISGVTFPFPTSPRGDPVPFEPGGLGFALGVL